MACYRSGGCGPYEMYSCSECPASKSEYAQKQSTDSKKEVRLIDADTLKEKLEAHHDFFVNAWGGFSNLPVKDKARVDEITSCIAEVVNAPTIDPESLRPQGEWSECDWVEYDGHGECIHHPKAGLRCSNCCNAFKKVLLRKDNYCPNCGAKMKGE